MITSWQEKLNSALPPKRQRLVLIGLLIVYAIALTYHVNEPFMRPSDEFDGTYGIAAWNWVIHGPVQLKFGLMTLAGKVLPGISRMFVISHPQFFIAPTALIYWLFGIDEWQTRLAPILFSLLSLIVFWRLVARVFKAPWFTATSSFFYALFPMGIFYGGLLTNDYLAVFSILALFLAVIVFEQDRQKKYLIGICVMTFIGGLSDWSFLFAAAAAWWYIALTKDYPQKKPLLLIMIGTVAASLSVTFWQIWSLLHVNPLAFLKALFVDRNVADAGVLSVLRFLNMRLNFDLIGFSEIGLILALAGAVYYISTYKKDRAKLLFLAMFAAPGILTYIVFYHHATIHQFFGLYVLPMVALLAGYGVSRVRKVWLISAIGVLMLISSVWYTSMLFAYSEFATDDFALFTRANAEVPIAAPICTDTSNSKFYLTPAREVEDPPCPADYSYFLLRQPQSYQKTYQLFSFIQTFYTDNFWDNIRSIGFSEAVGMEGIKSIPVVRQKLDTVFTDHDPRKDNAMHAKKAQAFIDEYKLRPVDCSTNFCLYEKNQVAAKKQ